MIFTLVFLFNEIDGLRLFDPENTGADVAAFAEMWPDTIYFELELALNV